MAGGIFCDLEKAFNCVNHNTLFSKLKCYDIIGTALNLTEPYLEDRFQIVVTDSTVLHNTTSSDFGKISHGVLQESILKPLLFLIHNNNLPMILINNSIPVLFADDTSVITTNSNTTNFQKDIKEVYFNLLCTMHSYLIM
jgi:hypothetical protein